MATKADKPRHGGARLGAGRPKGTKNLRTIAATELLAQAQERFPDFNPIAALIALAQDAMAEDADKPDPVLAKDCYVAVLPYLAPRFKPIEADIDRVVELEARLTRVKLEAHAQLLHDRPDLADRLDRAAQRAVTIVVETGVPRTPDAPEPIEGLAERLSGVSYAPPAERLSPPETPDEAPIAAPAPAPAPAGETPTAPVAPPAKPAPAPEPYRPISPAPEPVRFGMMRDDYSPFED